MIDPYMKNVGSAHHHNQLFNALDYLGDVIQQFIPVDRLDLDLIAAYKAVLGVALLTVHAVIVPAGNHCYWVRHAMVA